MQYYYTNSQNQAQGPVTLEQLYALANSGAVGTLTFVAPVGSLQWDSISSVIPELQSKEAVTNEPLALWSFILSLVGLLCCSFFASIPAVICGHMSLHKIKADPNIPGKNFAISGVIVGYIGIAFWTVYIVIGLLGGWD